jgi:hypothetical protein
LAFEKSERVNVTGNGVAGSELRWRLFSPESRYPPETPAPRRSWGLFFCSIAKDKPDSARSLFSKHKRELPDSLWVSLSIAVEANPANLRKFASLMELKIGVARNLCRQLTTQRHAVICAVLRHQAL